MISRYCLYICCVLFLLGCSDDLTGKKYKNYRKIAGFLNEYYTAKGRYPASLVQLENYFLAKQNQSDSKISHDPQNILGITNPYHREMVGYGGAYANAWDFEMVIEQGEPSFIDCKEKQILYHPANHTQGALLYQCGGFLGYAVMICYKGKCSYGNQFRYDSKTKMVYIDESMFEREQSSF